jgi:hypothetical protein
VDLLIDVVGNSVDRRVGHRHVKGGGVGAAQGLRTDFSTVKDAEQVVGVDGAGHSFAFGSAL